MLLNNYVNDCVNEMTVIVACYCQRIYHRVLGTFTDIVHIYFNLAITRETKLLPVERHKGKFCNTLSRWGLLNYR